MIFEDRYPGNASVMEKLLTSMEAGGLVAFTGAGTSMPALPGWGNLVNDLVDGAVTEGRLDGSTAAALRSETSDVLYVIDEIYNAVGEAQTKARVSKIFAALKQPTDAHRLLVKTQYERIMTLNYDEGLEKAFAEQHSQHVASITADQRSEVDEWLRDNGSNYSPPVLHWHGRSADASSIVLGGSDYVAFYEQASDKKETLRNIFKSRQVLMTGFGFSDPFIERELNSVMQPLPKTNSHFAIIGLDDSTQTSIQLERRKYSTKYKLETLFYPIVSTDAGPDHKALLAILEAIAKEQPRSNTNALVVETMKKPSTVKDPPVSYRTSLFTIGDRVIYCEPNIWKTSSDAEPKPEVKVTLAQLLSGDNHCKIQAPHEYGLSNLGKRMVADLAVAGEKALFRDAQLFPKYRKRIQSDSDFSSVSLTEKFTVVLDNFSVVDHQRTVRELINTYKNVRVIALQRSSYNDGLDDGLVALGFTSFTLTGLSRSDIRSVVNILAPERNSDDTSVIVEKVYSDLLQLCIPLTPSNVIMYSSVLCKDGNFLPVSRLHIVDRFVSEALQRASDAYADTFNFLNKIDLICEFCFERFCNDIPSFSEADWTNFCRNYQASHLVEFSGMEVLGDLVNGRVVVKDGSVYIFRYRMFFSYFVGRYIADRPDVLNACVTENKHLELDGLVEVLCGMLPDCSSVLDDLTHKLKRSMEQFYENYPIGGADLHEEAKWEINSQDEDLWNAISERLEKGPASTQELDELKTSIHAERRTDDQKVSIIKFIASEKSVTNNVLHLMTALESAKHANATSKKAAADAVMSGHVLVYEVASVFIPLIAEKKYVSWNGFTYINLIEDKRTGQDTSDKEADKERMQSLVAYALPSSVGRNAADQFGSRKLGQVFLALTEDPAISTSIKKYLLFCLLIRSKPAGWLKSTKRQVGNIKRDDLYLRHMLFSALKQFREEINTEAERLGLKELVATIRLRRDANLKSPSSQAIERAIGRLDEGGFWGKK